MMQDCKHTQYDTHQSGTEIDGRYIRSKISKAEDLLIVRMHEYQKHGIPVYGMPESMNVLKPYGRNAGRSREKVGRTDSPLKPDAVYDR